MPSRWDIFSRGQAIADLVAYGQNQQNDNVGERPTELKLADFGMTYQSVQQLQSSIRESASIKTERKAPTIKTERKSSPKAPATKTSPKKAAKKTPKSPNGVSKPKPKRAPKTQAVQVDPALVDPALAQVAESASGGSSSDSASQASSASESASQASSSSDSATRVSSSPAKKTPTKVRPPPEPSLREQLKTKGLWSKALLPAGERLYCSKCRSYANKSKFKTVERMASHLDTKHRTFRLTIFCDYSECPRSVCGFACNKEKYEHQKRFHKSPENNVADV